MSRSLPSTETAAEHVRNALYLLELELKMQQDPTPPPCVGTLTAAAERLRRALASLDPSGRTPP